MCVCMRVCVPSVRRLRVPRVTCPSDAVQMGFLYLRYVLNPRQVWDWLQYYIKDHEVIHFPQHPC